jgi:hypothetical protein
MAVAVAELVDQGRVMTQLRMGALADRQVAEIDLVAILFLLRKQLLPALHRLRTRVEKELENQPMISQVQHSAHHTAQAAVAAVQCLSVVMHLPHVPIQVLQEV